MAKPKLKVVGLDKQPFTFPGYRSYQQRIRNLVEVIQLVAANDDLNTRELAEKCNVANSTLYRLFSGKTRFPRSDSLWRMCTALGMPDAVFNMNMNPEQMKTKAKRRKRA